MDLTQSKAEIRSGIYSETHGESQKPMKKAGKHCGKMSSVNFLSLCRLNYVLIFSVKFSFQVLCLSVFSVCESISNNQFQFLSLKSVYAISCSKSHVPLNVVNSVNLGLISSYKLLI